MRVFKRIFIVLFCISFFHSSLNGQYANKKVRSVHEAYTDSLKNVEYNYVFPILGQGAYKKGFDIPYPAGIMANYMWMRQNILLENFQLGIKTDNEDIPLTDVDFIEFGENINTSYTVNVRPDLWIFPFLNVYGIFGYGSSTTEVNLTYPIELNSVVEQKISTAGVGLMSAFGIGPIWLSVDANFTWNKPELLDKAVNVNVLGLRAGHTFTFKNKPYRNIAVWMGGMRVGMSSSTVGAITLIDALPPEAWERRDEIVNDYLDWYNSLNPIGDAGKIIVADNVLTPIVERLDAADGSTVIRYGMDKRVQDIWNGVIGVQFQLNKSFMFRSEAGIIGNRKSILVSANYRFKI